MKKKILSILTASVWLISSSIISHATTDNLLKTDSFYTENSGVSRKLKVYTSDGNSLKDGYVQIYSIDQNKYVFIGKTDPTGQVNFKIANDKSNIKNQLKLKKINVIDYQYIIFSGNDKEVATQGMTISYKINDQHLSRLATSDSNDILTKDTLIPNDIHTTKFENFKDLKPNNNVQQNKDKRLTNNLNSSSILYENPIWMLSSDYNLGAIETTVAKINICDGVQSSFDMSKSSSGSINLSGGSIISATYNSGSTISCASPLTAGAYYGTSRTYKTNFNYHEQLWVSTWGEMTKLVPTSWDGYISIYDSYEPACTPGHIGDAYSQGYINVQGNQSKTISCSNGLTISGAATIQSHFQNYPFSVNATYTSSTYSALTRNFTNAHSHYLVYPEISQNYVIPN